MQELEQIEHLKASLRFLSQVLLDKHPPDGNDLNYHLADLAQFAYRASEDPPSAFPPKDLSERLLGPMIPVQPTIGGIYGVNCDLKTALINCVLAMRLWGAEEDGIPENGPIGAAYDQACSLLKKLNEKVIS